MKRSAARRLLPELGLVAIWALGAAGCSSDTTGADSEVPAAGKVFSPDTTSVADDEDELNLVAQVGLPGRVIKFFEPRPGLLLQVERGTGSDAQFDPKEARLSGSALYTYLTGKPAPQALLDAEALTTPSDDGAGGVIETIGGTELPVASTPSLTPQTRRYTHKATIDCATFAERYCTPTDRFWYSFNDTENNGISREGVNMMQAGLYCEAGTCDYVGHFGATEFLNQYDTALTAGWYTGWRWTTGGNGLPADSHSYPQKDGEADHCINYHY